MGEIEQRGFVAHEFRRQRETHQIFQSLADEAAAVLKAQGSHSPDVLARSWEELGTAEQAVLGDELLDISHVASSFTASDVLMHEISTGAAQLFLDAIETYHDTLPFAKAERLWLSDARFHALEEIDIEKLGMSAVQWVMAQHDEVVMLGRPQAVSGAELVKREWDWMRGAGEYEGGSTYDNATRVALQGIVTLFDAED
jgi:hypothetical protein